MTNASWAVLAGILWHAAATGSAEPGDQPPSEAYLDPVDRQIAATGNPVGIRFAPCQIAKKRKQRDGHVFEWVKDLPTDKCVQMKKPQRFSGLWSNAFESSYFCPAPAVDCTLEGSAWLSWKRRVIDEKQYRVEFIGRRTAFAGGYGHFGLWPHEVIVDRMISMKEIKK